MTLIPLPANRVAMFEKNDRKLLKEIEKRGSVTLKIKEEQMEIEGEGGTEFFAEQVVKAICMGFEPQKAFKLFNDEFFLEIIDLEQVVSRNEKRLALYKARIIGTEGKARTTIEELSDAFVSVYENKIALIGRFEELKAAKEGIKMLLEGKTHNSVYAFLEKQRKGL